MSKTSSVSFETLPIELWRHIVYTNGLFRYMARVCKAFNDVNVVSHVSGCKDLKRLCVVNTPISDLTPIANFRHLTWFDCSYTALSSIDPLDQCPELMKVFARKTRIVDVSALKKLLKLRVLDVLGTNVVDVKMLDNRIKIFI